MSRDRKTTVVPVYVVQRIVQQLSEVSLHTTSASNAMRRLVAEITLLMDMRTMDTATVVEWLAAVGARSGSPRAVNNWPGRSGTTDPALRKLLGKDPEFPKYDGNPEYFLPWFVAVDERKDLRRLSDQAAIIFAT